MTVRDAPYELVCLFADADAQRFIEQLLRRGHERGCLRPASVRSIRDPKRDTVWRDPLAFLRPPVADPGEHKLLICWDHHGSGNESIEQAKTHVLVRLQQAGFGTEDVCIVCFEPELETVFSPVGDQVLSLFAARRKAAVPSDEAVLARLARNHRIRADSREMALRDHPKEWISAALDLLRLKRAPDIYEELGQKLSMSGLKRHEIMSHIADHLQRWFPPEPA